MAEGSKVEGGGKSPFSALVKASLLAGSALIAVLAFASCHAHPDRDRLYSRQHHDFSGSFDGGSSGRNDHSSHSHSHAEPGTAGDVLQTRLKEELAELGLNGPVGDSQEGFLLKSALCVRAHRVPLAPSYAITV